MALSCFGATHAPLGKNTAELWDNGQIKALAQQFHWLLQSPVLAC